MVPGVPVGAAELVDHGAGGGLVGHPADVGEEAGPLDLELRGGVAGRDQVVAHQTPTTSPPIRMMKADTTTMKKTRTKPAPREIASRAPR